MKTLHRCCEGLGFLSVSELKLRFYGFYWKLPTAFRIPQSGNTFHGIWNVDNMGHCCEPSLMAAQNAEFQGIWTQIQLIIFECSQWRDYREMSWMATHHNYSLPTAHAENNTSGHWHESPGVALSRTGNPSSAPDSLFTHSVCQDVRGLQLIWPDILQRRRNALINPVCSLFSKIKSKWSFIALFNT